MKRTIRLIALLLSLTLLLGICVLAGELWSEEYYRANDTSDGLSELEQEDLDAECLSFMERFHLDIALLAITSDRYEGETLEELAEGYYRDCGFGYGENADGFQIVWDTDTGEVVIVPFGAAADAVPRDYLDYAQEGVQRFSQEYSCYGTLYAGLRYLETYLADGETAPEATPEKSVLVPEPEQEPEVPALPNDQRVGEGADMPAWYPVDPANFPMYHDENAPRVVDTADLFTDQEEAEMEARLTELRGQLDRDIVIFTDVSTYGLERKTYAADFYDFNGYGCGEDREGVCMFVCMDPNDRGWWCCCTGPVTMELYTESIANDIDDVLYEYMAAGRYYEGIRDWIENFRRLYTTGFPFTPDWMPAAGETRERVHDAETSRVMDDAHLLTVEERQRLEEKAGEISRRQGIDLAVGTAYMPGSMTREEYAEALFRYNGYGQGDSYDGVLLMVFKRYGYSPETVIYGSGAGADKLTEVGVERLRNRIGDNLLDREYETGMSRWLDLTDHLLRTGRVPRGPIYWGAVAIFALLMGLAFGGWSLHRAKKHMQTPALKTNADAYLVKGSLTVEKVSDTFLHTTTTRVYDPVEDKSSGSGSSSGSSGSSSYSSSYTGSSGSTHSGSGRNF